MDDEVMGHTVRMIKARSLVSPGGGVKIGSITDARWEQTFKLLSETAVLPARFDYKAAYTLRFMKDL
jgi:NitT/TauT family transport system substrate-binding protein